MVAPFRIPDDTVPVTTCPDGLVALNPVENVSSLDFENGRHPVISTFLYPDCSRTLVVSSVLVHDERQDSEAIMLMIRVFMFRGTYPNQDSCQ